MPTPLALLIIAIKFPAPAQLDPIGAPLKLHQVVGTVKECRRQGQGCGQNEKAKNTARLPARQKRRRVPLWKSSNAVDRRVCDLQCLNASPAQRNEGGIVIGRADDFVDTVSHVFEFRLRWARPAPIAVRKLSTSAAPSLAYQAGGPIPKSQTRFRAGPG